MHQLHETSFNGYILIDMEETKKEINPSLDDRLFKARMVVLSGEITMESANKFIREILALDCESNEPITVLIDSPGGDVYSGFAIYDMIRFVRSSVKVVGVGLVASAAALIYLAVSKDRRYSLENATYLIHQPLSEMKGVAIDMAIQAEKIGELRKKLDKIIAESTGKDLAEVEKDTERDHWLTSDEAASYGIVGKIVRSIGELS